MSARESDLAHATRRMLQALDAYWAVHYDGGSCIPKKTRHPEGDNLMEHWWARFETYRGRGEKILAADSARRETA